MTAPLVKSARRLLGAARHKPSQADLRRTISTAYYAAFDALARLCADEIVGSSPTKRALPEWSRVYRALNHGRSQIAAKELFVVTQGGASDRRLPDFCATLEKMRLLRLEADYDPAPLNLRRADVALLIDEVELAIAQLGEAATAYRRSLAFACVLAKRTVS